MQRVKQHGSNDVSKHHQHKMVAPRFILSAPPVAHSRKRLTAELHVVRNELDMRKNRQKPCSNDAPWLREATENLAAAERDCARRRYQAAWIELKAAQRSMIFDPTGEEKAKTLATSLWRDALALQKGRRRQAMLALLCKEEEEEEEEEGEGEQLLSDIGKQRAHIAKAAELLDDHFDAQHYRIELRGRHLVTLFWILPFTLVSLVGLAYCERIDLSKGAEDFGQLTSSPGQLVTVILLGLLGASLSVAQSIARSDLTSKITEQRVVSFSAWMRPVFGAAAAVIVYVLLLANAHLGVIGAKFSSHFSVVAVLTIVAGFSERFITTTLERVANSNSEGSSRRGNRRRTVARRRREHL